MPSEDEALYRTTYGGAKTRHSSPLILRLRSSFVSAHPSSPLRMKEGLRIRLRSPFVSAQGERGAMRGGFKKKGLYQLAQYKPSSEACLLWQKAI